MGQSVSRGDLRGGGGRFSDLKRRLLFLLGALIVYRIGTHVPVTGIDPVRLAELFQSQAGGILDMFNMFSGGALSRFSVLALGIMPYISASIIMQLMTVVSPTLEALKKEGEAGRRKITQYTRYGTLALATFQALGIAIALEGQAGLVIDPGLLFRFTTVVTLVTGTIVVEQVFSLPGLGRLIFQAISNRDVLLVQNIVMLLAAVVIVINFVVDVLYAVIDPRLKLHAA